MWKKLDIFFLFRLKVNFLDLPNLHKTIPNASRNQRQIVLRKWTLICYQKPPLKEELEIYSKCSKKNHFFTLVKLQHLFMRQPSVSWPAVNKNDTTTLYGVILVDYCFRQLWKQTPCWPNILRNFKNSTFYVNHFLQIVGLTLSTLSNFISAHHREQ